MKKNYWPHGILALILTVVISGAYSINVAFHTPVQESTYFMKKYQDFEDNAYALEKEKDAFDKKYKIFYSVQKFRLGSNKLNLKILDKLSNKPVMNADIDLLLTRPNTNDLNKKLKPVKKENGIYIFNDIDIENLGRWKILTTTKIGKYKGFNSYDINATRK